MAGKNSECRGCGEEVAVGDRLCCECQEWQQVDAEQREDTPDIRDSYPMEYWTER